MMFDRISVNSALLVAAFLAVLLLGSQSAASYPSYCLCLAMALRFRDWNDVFHCPLVWPTVVLLVYLTLTCAWSEGRTVGDALSQLVRAILIFLFVVSFAECQLRGVLQTWLYRAFSLAGAAVALVCITIFFVATPADGRLYGLGQLDSPVVAALVFGFAALTTLHLMLLDGSAEPSSRKYGGRILSSLCLLVLFAATLLTGSRSASVALLIGSVALVLAHKQENSARFLLAFALCVIVLGALLGFALLVPELESWVLPRGDSYRVVIWQETLARLSSSPWFGLGILTPDDVPFSGYMFQHPHNLYLSVAYQGGILGLLLFLWLLVRVVRELLRHLEKADAKFAIALLAMALPAYMLDGHELIDKVSEIWFLIWLPVALALGLRWHSTWPQRS